MTLIRKLCLLAFALAAFTTFAPAKDRALLVGIEDYQNTVKCDGTYRNYQEGCVPPTYGGVDDAVSMKAFLGRYYKFAPSSVKLLLGKNATAEEIRRQIKLWLIAETRPGDRVFFLFSGHGTQLDDQVGGDEEDHMDEAIVAYDLQNEKDERKFIRDDEFKVWREQLKGRHVVMLFDSCHSGTLSRGVSPKRPHLMRYLPVITADVYRPRARGLSDRDDYSFLPRKGDAKDLFIAKESIDDDGGDAVFITASLPYQQAFPIYIEGKYRGALTYAFEKAHSQNDRLPSVVEIKRRLRDEMTNLGEQDLLLPQIDDIQKRYDEKYQVPSVEIFSKCDNGDSPLFAIGSSSTCEIQSPTSNLHISFKMKETKPLYFEDDDFEFDVSVSQEAYLYIIVFSEKDVAHCVFPNKYDDGNKIKNISLSKEMQKKKGYTFSAGEPFGRDIWVVLATTRPLPVRASQEGSWNDMFRDIGLPSIKSKVVNSQSQTRGVAVKPADPLKANEWQAATLILETREKIK